MPKFAFCKSFKKILKCSINIIYLLFQADLKERYSVNELLADLAGCRATRVLLFVDQSYSGVLSKRLRGSQKHLNVVLIQSQTRQTHNHQSQRLNPGWEDSSWSLISPATCLLDHLRKVIYDIDFFFFPFMLQNIVQTSSSTTDSGYGDVPPSGAVGRDLKRDVGGRPVQCHATSD